MRLGVGEQKKGERGPGAPRVVRGGLPLPLFLKGVSGGVLLSHV